MDLLLLMLLIILDTFSCKPRVLDIVGPAPIVLDDSAHFLGLITCQFTANA